MPLKLIFSRGSELPHRVLQSRNAGAPNWPAEAQIGCARVFNTQDQYEDAHYNAREMTVPVLDRQSGVPIRVYGVVPKMSLTPGSVWRGAPAVGEDTTSILSNLLGFSEQDIAELYEDSIVHRTEPFTSPQVEAVHP